MVKDVWTHWYTKEYAIDKINKTKGRNGLWVEYSQFHCSDGTSWPEKVRMSQYHKDELVGQLIIPVAFTSEVTEMIQKMNKHIDDLTPINLKISKAYYPGVPKTNRIKKIQS